MKESAIKPPVIIEEKLLANGLKLAFATLNAPKSLNALSLPMIDVLLVILIFLVITTTYSKFACPNF